MPAVRAEFRDIMLDGSKAIAFWFWFNIWVSGVKLSFDLIIKDKQKFKMWNFDPHKAVLVFSESQILSPFSGKTSIHLNGKCAQMSTDRQMLYSNTISQYTDSVQILCAITERVGKSLEATEKQWRYCNLGNSSLAYSYILEDGRNWIRDIKCMLII